MSRTATSRSGRNRSVTLSDEERRSLAAGLAECSEIGATNFTDAVFWGDNAEALRRLPDGFADLVILDPPYNASKRFGSTRFSLKSDDEYREYLAEWLPAVCRKLKDNGSLYMCGDWKCTAAMQEALERELTVVNRITWQREKGRGSAKNWKNSMEDIWFAVKDPANYKFNASAVMLKRRVVAPYRVDGTPKDWQETGEGKFRLTYASNFWDDVTVPFWSMRENTPHPTQKPEKLIAKLILASSDEGDMVFDPFMGSGTTCVTARKLGRHYCGVEIDKEYCLYALKRLNEAAIDKSIQGYEDGVFWERNTLYGRICQGKSKSST